MVVLVSNNPNQINFLEWELITHKIKYRVVKKNKFGLSEPYLIIDGVPLTFEKSVEWLKEYENGH